VMRTGAAGAGESVLAVAGCLRTGLAEGIGGSARGACAAPGLDGGFVRPVRDLVLVELRFRLLFPAPESSDSLLIVETLDTSSSDSEAARAGFAGFLPISITSLRGSKSEKPYSCPSPFDSPECEHLLEDLLDRDSVDDSSSIFSFGPASCSYIVSIYCALMGTLVLWCLLSASRLTPSF